jgi:thiol-disulfide isomerase/thioredoxin
MKKTIVATVLAAICCCNINAQETTEPAAPAAVSSTAAVPAKLQEMIYITDTKPAADAQFYVYLSSASWCPPCRAIMPKIVAEYPAIKAAGGEIILLCCDRTAEAGRGYVKKYGAKFPSVMADSRSMGSAGLPGLQVPRGIPAITIVTPAGELIHAGHAATLLNWKSIIKK